MKKNVTPFHFYHFLQVLFSNVLFNGDLAIGFKSFVELVSNVPFHSVCSTIITDAAGMSPANTNIHVKDVKKKKSAIM